MLWCEFSPGFIEPEMVKKRPVIVLTPAFAGRRDLVTVVPLSTSRPAPIRDYHYQLPANCLPMIGQFQKGETWVKGDMLYTMGFHRLDPIKLTGRTSEGKRKYFSRRLGRDHMREIYRCVLHGINMAALVPHIPK